MKQASECEIRLKQRACVDKRWKHMEKTLVSNGSVESGTYAGYGYILILLV